MTIMTGDTKLMAQHQELHAAAWGTEKRLLAKHLAETLPAPQKQVQELGVPDLSLVTAIMDETREEELKKGIEILSVPEGILCSALDIDSISPNNRAMTTYFGTIIPSTEDKCTALHYAHLKDIVFIYIPAGFRTQTPLHIRKLAQGRTTFHHVLILAEKGSSCSIIEEEEQEEAKEACKKPEETYRSTVVEAVVEEESHVSYACLQNYDHSSTHVIKKSAHVARNARMDWIECYFGGKYTRSTVSSFLNEEGAKATTTTLFFGEGMQLFDLFSNTYQKGKHTFTEMNAMGVVRDAARSLCKGLIKIDQQSYGSVGHQKAKTVVMDRNAQANAIPNMEIDNFDVRATHEASVGQVDKKKLFYLMSRGLSETQARQKIVEGFFVPIIEKLPQKEVQTKIRELIHNKLSCELHCEESEMTTEEGDV